MICARGHNCYPPRPNNEASANVFVNGRRAHRIGDGWFNHCCKHHHGGCHHGTTVSGSYTVLINGIGISRVGDQVDCGSLIMTGSRRCNRRLITK